MKRALLLDHVPAPVAGEAYATAEDFQKFFALEMQSLFRLALLLTADANEAECCVIRAMRECLSGQHVFKQWVGAWVRRTVIREGIRQAGQFHEMPARRSAGEQSSRSPAFQVPLRATPFADSAGIFTLGTFERLVWVLSVLEHYPIADCALLLGRAPHEVREALKRALGQVAAFEQECEEPTVSGPVEGGHSTGISDQDGLDWSCGTLLN